MIWVFASVVLILMVLHPGFRRVAFWMGGIAAGLLAIGIAVLTSDNRKSGTSAPPVHEQRRTTSHEHWEEGPGNEVRDPEILAQLNAS